MKKIIIFFLASIAMYSCSSTAKTTTTSTNADATVTKTTAVNNEPKKAVAISSRNIKTISAVKNTKQVAIQKNQELKLRK